MEGESHGFSRWHAEPGTHAVVHWKNVAIFVWCTRAEGPWSKMAVEFAGELTRDYPLFSVLHVVEETAGLPTAEGREALVSVIRRNKHNVGCIGLLLPQSAVLATLLRTFVRGVRTLVRMPLDVMIGDDLTVLASEFTSAHQRQTSVKFTARELASAVLAARKLARG